MNFFNLPNPSSGAMGMEFTQLLREMNTRNFPGGKALLTRKADYLTATCLLIA
jgi:hypothetical protein